MKGELDGSLKHNVGLCVCVCSDGWKVGNKEETEHGSCEVEYSIWNCCYYLIEVSDAS